jgi:hypothetical protein
MDGGCSLTRRTLDSTAGNGVGLRRHSAPSARGPIASACCWTRNRVSMTQGIPQGRVPQETDVGSLFSSKRTLNAPFLSADRSAQGLSRQPDETLPYLNVPGTHNIRMWTPPVAKALAGSLTHVVGAATSGVGARVRNNSIKPLPTVSARSREKRPGSSASCGARRGYTFRCGGRYHSWGKEKGKR